MSRSPIPTGSMRRVAVVVLAVLSLSSGGAAIALAAAEPTSPPGPMAQPLPTACPDAFQNCAFLTLVTAGTGGGTTTSPVGSLDCSYVSGGVQAGTCYGPVQWSANEPSLTVNLTLTPQQGSYACVTGVKCGKQDATLAYSFSVAPNETKVVKVEYDISSHRLLIEMQGTPGTVTAGSTTCTSTPCDGGQYPWGSDVTITAAPAAGASFIGWTGACATQPPACHLTITADTDTTAVFSGTASSPAASSTPKPSHTPKPTAHPTATAAASAAPSAAGSAASESAVPEPSLAPVAVVAGPSASPEAGADQAASSGGSIPWLPIIAIIVVVAVAVNVIVYQVMRSRRSGG